MAYNREKDKDRNYQEEINEAVKNNDFATASALEKDRNEKIDAEGMPQSLKTNEYKFDATKDYQSEINDAVDKGDYALASSLEKERNNKISNLGLEEQKTYNYTMPDGVSGDLYNKYNQKFEEGDISKEYRKEAESAFDKYKDYTDVNDILSSDTRDALNKGFVVPDSVKEADKYLEAQLEKIKSGKTSYTDQVNSMLDKILNREDFSYDVDEDKLFQQALASAVNSGKQAMQDTIGQASALTGGYGSTYATTAANQVYNSFIEDAYDNVPQYYKMALEAYISEGEEMYKQYSALSDMDTREYNRMATAYDATSQYRDRLYNEAYSEYRDSITDAYSAANLEMAEYGQKASDYYNLYNVASNMANTQYERDYRAWSDSINHAYQMMAMQNSDYQNSENRKHTSYESQLTREHTSYENQLTREHTSYENQLTREHTSAENQLTREHTSYENQLNREHDSAENQLNREHNEILTYANIASNEKIAAMRSSVGGSSGASSSDYARYLSTLSDEQFANEIAKVHSDGAYKNFQTTMLSKDAWENAKADKRYANEGVTEITAYHTYKDYVTQTASKMYEEGDISDAVLQVVVMEADADAFEGNNSNFNDSLLQKYTTPQFMQSWWLR